jgi:phosphoribosylaminoimidazole-succinocarboxamide synthase
MQPAFLQSALGALPVKRGKVRDMYDLGDRVLMVATDRLSAFDWVFPNGVPDRGRVLTQISRFWFETLGERHHMLSTDLRDVELPADAPRAALEGRSMICRKAEPALIECVVRGYLVGSGWKDYQASGEVCGIKLPAGLRLCDQLPEPIFTPATKAATGHDENISFSNAADLVGRETAEELRRRSLALYQRGAEHAGKCGILLADTKFEWGWADGELILIDEALTPDSSRFWPAGEYQPGRNQPSFDKQFVRDYLETTPWDKNCPPPPLPDHIIRKTRDKYIEAYERLSGREFAWK